MTKRNTKVPIVLLALNAELYDDLKSFQFYQDKSGVIEFRYVPKNYLDSDRITAIQNDIRFQIRHEAELKLVEVSKLDVKPSGKIPFLVQKLSV